MLLAVIMVSVKNIMNLLSIRMFHYFHKHNIPTSADCNTHVPTALTVVALETPASVSISITSLEAGRFIPCWKQEVLV
jgi:hypothetical protein